MKNKKVNELEEMPIPKLAIKTSLPMIISMISIALYGIVDTIFVSNISEKALTAITLAYPIQNIITGIGVGTGIGLNSLLARSLGEKDKEKVQKTTLNGILLTFLTWILLAIISILGIKPFLSYFSKDSELITLGSSYLYIISIFSIGTLFQIITEKILEAYGKTKESMIVQIVGSVINLVLDPILIYGFLFVPAFGITGAAIATVIGQIMGMIIGIYYIKKYKLLELNLNKENIKLDKEIVKNIYKVGIPTMILEIISSFIILFINKILIEFSGLAVAVWGVYTKVEKFVLIIIYGLNYGMIPIIGYNYGAKRIDRVKEAIKFFLKLGVAVALIGTIIVCAFPVQILKTFDVSKETIEIGIVAFRILSIGFVFASVSMMLSAAFQSFGNATYSLIIKLSRKLIIAFPIIIIFKNIIGMNIIWIAFTMAEIITMIISILMFRVISKKILEIGE